MREKSFLKCHEKVNERERETRRKVHMQAKATIKNFKREKEKYADSDKKTMNSFQTYVLFYIWGNVLLKSK